MSRHGHNTATKNNQNTNMKDQLLTINQKLLVERLSSITVEQLDSLASTGETTMAEATFGPDFTVPPAKGQWKYILVPAGMKKGVPQKRLVLLPDDHRTRGIWRLGQVNLAVNAGLTHEHAKIWSESSQKGRHELLSTLAAVLGNQQAIDAYLAFGKADKETPGNVNVGEWNTKFNLKDDLTYKNRVALALQVEEIILATQRSEKKKQAAAQAAAQVQVSPALAKLFAMQEAPQAVAVKIEADGEVTGNVAVPEVSEEELEALDEQADAEAAALANKGAEVEVVEGDDDFDTRDVVEVIEDAPVEIEVAPVAETPVITAPALSQFADEDLVISEPAESSVAAAQADNAVLSTESVGVEGSA